MLLALFLIVLGFLRLSRIEGEKEDIVGAIFATSINDRSWAESHYTGIQAACDEIGLRFEYEENVAPTPEDLDTAIGRLVKKGCDIIFLTSDSYGKNIYSTIEKYHDIEFYTISADSDLPNLTTYYGRIYQARFLAGMLAGRMTKNNTLGFVSRMQVVKTHREINAFMLGAKSVNPDVVVKVRFTESWVSYDEEKEAARKLIEEDGVDVITYHTSTHATIEVAEEHSVYSIGFNNRETGYSEKYLASVNCNWRSLYKTILNDFLQGDMSPGKYYWHGVVFGTVSLDLYSPLIPETVREELAERREKLINVQDVFYGDIFTNEGERKCSKGQRIRDDALLRRMDWFVEGVEVYE